MQSFHVEQRRWTTSRCYAAESTKQAFLRDTFNVGIHLLTAVSSNDGETVCIRQNLACMPHHTTLQVRCAHDLDNEFAKLFQQNFQKLPFKKIQILENLVLYKVLSYLLVKLVHRQMCSTLQTTNSFITPIVIIHWTSDFQNSH